METNQGSKRRNNGLWRKENHANAFYTILDAVELLKKSPDITNIKLLK